MLGCFWASFTVSAFWVCDGWLVPSCEESCAHGQQSCEVGLVDIHCGHCDSTRRVAKCVTGLGSSKSYRILIRECSYEIYHERRSHSWPGPSMTRSETRHEFRPRRVSCLTWCLPELNSHEPCMSELCQHLQSHRLVALSSSFGLLLKVHHSRKVLMSEINLSH